MVQARKGKRRARPTTDAPLDDDLGLLASVIAEHSLDTHAGGWFVHPWRCGVNAAKLARFVALDKEILEGPWDPEMDHVVDLIDGGGCTYERAGQLYSHFTFPKIDTNAARLAAAALRCLMLYIARSDGGGHVYNEILYPVFSALPTTIIAPFIEEWRCRDAIGTTSSHRGDKYDRERGAFRIAWQRGLYHAAYSIKPVNQ